VKADLNTAECMADRSSWWRVTSYIRC